MDSNLKQWRLQQQQQVQEYQVVDHESGSSPAKIPRLFFDSQIIKQQQKHQKHHGVVDIVVKTEDTTDYSLPPQLHLFVPTDEQNEQDISTKVTTAYLSDHTSTRNTKMGGAASYFSHRQWQELELQALIYRHLLAGAAIPPQLLQLVHKSLYNNLSLPSTNSLSSAYYAHPLQQYSHYHPTMVQSGYWGRAAMDPEPGRCRRTDGKKWRCSRDIVGGHKYCERHINRGRNRSRKPVELQTTTTSTPLSTLSGTTNTTNGNGCATGGAASCHVTGGVPVPFDILEPPASIESFLLAQRPSGSQAEHKFTTAMENKVLKPGGQALRHFFDDLSNRSSDNSSSSTSLSISTTENTTSDFSLKLATGNANRGGEREKTHSGWGSAGWGTSQVAPLGGPLAEVLRSSRGSNASPTSVLNLVK